MTPEDEADVRSALAVRKSGRPSRLGDRAIRAGRGTSVGLHHLLTLVLVDWSDPAERCMPSTHYHAVVHLSENPETALDQVSRHVAQHAGGALVTLELRRATWWTRVRAWWRLRRGG